MNAPMNDRTMVGDLIAHRAAQAAKKAQENAALTADELKAILAALPRIDAECDPIRNVEQHADTEMELKKGMFLASW